MRVRLLHHCLNDKPDGGINGIQGDEVNILSRPATTLHLVDWNRETVTISGNSLQSLGGLSKAEFGASGEAPSETTSQNPFRHSCQNQKMYFNANWIRRGFTEVVVILPKVLRAKLVAGLLN